MVNRRQFGIWTASALFLGPQLAVAGEPVAQQAKAAKKTTKAKSTGPLDALELTAVADDREPGERLVLQLSAKNTEKTGMVLIVDTAGAELESGGERTETMSWMNDQFPYSRRIVAPSFVDIGPESTTVAGTVNVELPEDVAADTVVKITLRLSDDHGHSRLVELPPLPLNPKATKS